MYIYISLYIYIFIYIYLYIYIYTVCEIKLKLFLYTHILDYRRSKQPTTQQFKVRHIKHQKASRKETKGNTFMFPSPHDSADRDGEAGASRRQAGSIQEEWWLTRHTAPFSVGRVSRLRWWRRINAAEKKRLPALPVLPLNAGFLGGLGRGAFRRRRYLQSFSRHTARPLNAAPRSLA